MEERVGSRPAYDMNPGLSRGMYEGPKDNLSSRLYDGPHDKSHITEEPDEAKVSRPGVCPAKAGMFSRRQTYQGKSQSPVARSAVAYLRLADNVLGPPPFRLRRVNQPVVRSQIRFSASR